MHHLTEHTRRAYLEAMGLTQWYARHPVAHGLDLVWPTTADETTTQPVELTDQSTSGADILARVEVNPAAPATTKAITDSTMSPKAESTETSPAVSSTETTGDRPQATTGASDGRASRQSSGIEFVQRWWARGPWCIVDTRAKNMPQPQQKAADRLMAALAQVVCGERTPAVAHHIDWPLFVNRSIPHDADEARFYLSQKWEAVQQQAPTRRLILLGELTPELLGFDYDRTHWTTDAGLSCLSGPGTSELMHLPGRKREFWQRLRQWLSEEPT